MRQPPRDHNPERPNAGKRHQTPTAEKSAGPELGFDPGELADKYRIIRKIGQGGMGSVYEVEHIFLQTRFAMKVLTTHGPSAISLRRFQQEAKAAALLDYPHLVKVQDFGIINESQPYMVMDLVEGETLSDLIRRVGPLPLDMVLQIFKQACLGLHYAHSQSVVHRDIKPSNIIVSNYDDPSRTKVVIVDFGIAKFESQDRHSPNLTRTGDVIGTPTYMSPEQCMGHESDHRSDIYSLGCVLFECLTGNPPFMADSALSLMMKHNSEKPPTLSEATLGKQFPPDLQRVIEKLLAKKPSARYSDLTDFAIDLDRLKAGEPVHLGLFAPTPRKEQSIEYLKIGVASLVLIISSAIGYLLGTQTAQSPRISTAGISERKDLQDVAFQSMSEKIDLKSLPVPPASGLNDQAQQPFSGPLPGESSSRIFAFPSYSLGTLRPIQGEQLIAFSHGQFVSGQHVEAKGIVLIKNFQGLDLEPSNVLTSNPVLFKSFRADDIAILSFYDSFSDFDARDLAAIAGFKSLVQLDLDHANQLGDRALDQIASLPNLKRLTLTPARFSPGKLATFPTMKRLNRLALKGFNDTNVVLKSIDGSDSLNELFFENCTVDAQGLKHVASIRALHSLHFDACTIHNDDFAGLSQSNSIEGFLVRDCPDVDIHLFDCLKLGSVKDIRLGGSQWTPAVLNEIRKRMPKVSVISLQHAQHGEDEFQGTLNEYLK